jgi:hypothetical protein
MTIVELEKALKARLEPVANTDAGLERMIQASIAVSLKRIADALEKPQIVVQQGVPNVWTDSGYTSHQAHGQD